MFSAFFISALYCFVPFFRNELRRSTCVCSEYLDRKRKDKQFSCQHSQRCHCRHRTTNRFCLHYCLFSRQAMEEKVKANIAEDKSCAILPGLQHRLLILQQPLPQRNNLNATAIFLHNILLVFRYNHHTLEALDRG